MTGFDPEIDNKWQFDLPENHNMNADMFTQLHKALKDSSVHSIVTVKDGVIIDEYYGSGYDENSKFPLHSRSSNCAHTVGHINYPANICQVVFDIFFLLKMGITNKACFQT